ncbi:MAG: glycosyltransferase family 4 protein [Acidimicrobiales bacterium]
MTTVTLNTGGLRRPTVVHVTTTDMSLDWLLRPQLEAFSAAGFEVIGASATGPHVAALEASGIRHVAIENLTRAMRPGNDARAYRELVALFRRLRPDIVHTHNPKPGVLGRLAAWRAGVGAVVNTVHGLYAQPTDGWLRRGVVYGIERAAATCSDIELVQNPEDVDTLLRLGLPERKVRLLGNGVDLDRFGPQDLRDDELARRRVAIGVDPEAVVCGVVGRLVNEKGYREVLTAAHRLRATAPNLQLVVVGPTEPDKADAVPADLVDRARRDGVVFLGQRDDVHELYPLFDLYLLASYREGFPRSAMEAAACGLPLVVTDIRGGRQVVDHDHTGLLIPAADADAIVDAVGALALDPGRRRLMGKRSLAKARAEFDQQHQINRTLAAYGELLAQTVATSR